MSASRWDQFRAALADEQRAAYARSKACARPCSSCGRLTTALNGRCTRGDCLAVELELRAEAIAAFADGRSAYDPELVELEPEVPDAR